MNGCIKDDGSCKRNYYDNTSTAETSFDEKGYPVYRRPHANDQRVVPHNREILLDWDGHANLEFAASTYCIFYLYSYLFKGNKKVQLQLNNLGDIDKSDEINIYLRGRMLTSMDAMWRVFGYQTYPAPFPSVRLIKAKLPDEVNAWSREGNLTDIYVYFMRPYPLRHLTICQFYTNYDYKYKLDDARFRDNLNQYDPDGSLRFCELPATNSVKKFYIYKRLHPSYSITRLQGVSADAGEIFYVRYMLRDLPFDSFSDMLTVHGRQCHSFQEAAYERGLLSDDSEAYETFQEARLYQPPSGLRALFVLLTIQGFPTLRIFEDLELREALYLDFLRGNSPSAIALANEKLLEDLHERFSRQNKDMTIYGLPKPIHMLSELDREQELVGDRNSNLQWLQQLHVSHPLTDEMQPAYDEIKQAIQNGKTAFFMIRGIGGAGKTHFAKKVFNFIIKSNLGDLLFYLRLLRLQDQWERL